MEILIPHKHLTTGYPKHTRIPATAQSWNGNRTPPLKHDGPNREAARLNILEIDLKLGRLRRSEDTYSSFAIVMRVLSLNNVLSQVNETNQLIAEITAHRATLG
jgi:hypothetical protein